MFRSVVPAFFPVIVIVPSKTFLLPETTLFSRSTVFIQTELEGTAEFLGSCPQPGSETAVISAISGSEIEIVRLKPDSPEGTSSITI